MKHERIEKAKEDIKENLFQIITNALYKSPNKKAHDISDRLY